MLHSKGHLNTEDVDFLLESGNGQEQEAQNAAPDASRQVVTMRGDLEQIHLADIFQTLGTAKMEGMLAVHNPVEQRHVYFRNGQVQILVAQRTANRRIGQRLIAAGILDGEQLRKVLVQQRKQQAPLGQLLVQAGYLTADQLEDVLAQQVEEELYGLFTWEHGEFEFYRGPCTDPATLARLQQCPRFEVNSLLLEIARRADEWESIVQAIGSLDEVPILAPGASAEQHDDTHRAVLQAVDGKTSFRSLGDNAMLPLFDCARAARDLVTQGVLQRATAEQLLDAAQAHLDSGHPKNALMVAHTLRSRSGQQPLPVVRQLAGLLRACNEGGLACMVALEAAQAQTDPALALELAREACSHNPRDLGALSFLRTTMLAHLPADAPELAETTLALLDGLLADGDADHALQLIEEIEQLGAKTPDVLLRQARALAKKKDNHHAVAVFVQAAEAFGKDGDLPRQIEAYDLALRLDRDRKDIRKTLRALRMTPRKRLVRLGIFAAVAVLLLAMGAVWLSSHLFAQRLARATDEVQTLLAAGNFTGARSALERHASELGACAETAALEESIRMVEARHAGELHAAAHRRAAEQLQIAGAALEQGDLTAALTIYRELCADESVRAEAQIAADARIDGLARDLDEAARRLGAHLPPLPADLTDKQQFDDGLAFLRQHARASWIRAAREVLQLQARNQLVVPGPDERRRLLLATAQRALPTLEQADARRAAYEEHSTRTEEQRRLDPLFKAAIEHEQKHDFRAALAEYQQLLDAKAGNAGVLTHFRERVAALTALTRSMDELDERSRKGDLAGARTQLAELKRLAPTVPFEQLVRLPATIRTSLPGAVVRWNGAEVGVTPCTATFVPGARNEVVLERPRFRRERIELPKGASGALDVLLTLQPERELELPAGLDHPPVAGTGRSYGVDKNGAAFALDAASQDLVWRTATGDAAGWLSPAVLHEQSVLFASLEGPVRAFDRKTGQLRWQHPDLPTEVAPALVGERLALATQSSALVLLDAVRGGELLRSPLPAMPAGDVFACGNRIVVPLQNGTVEARDARTLAPVWRSNPDSMGANLACTGSRIAAMRDDGLLSVRDAITGTVVWQTQHSGSALGRLAIDPEGLLVTLDDRLLLVDLRDGRELWSAPRPEAGWLGAARLLGTTIVAPLRDGSVWVYRRDAATPHYRLDGDRKNVQVAAAADGGLLLVAGRTLRAYRSLP